MLSERIGKLASLACVVACCVFVFAHLDPSLLFSNTTTAGGDTGAHVMLPAFLEHQLLAHGRLAGWNPGWFDGFPFPTFYFPLPALVVVALNGLFPYNIAFKLATVLGSVFLPVAVWAFARLSGLRRPLPEAMAASSVLFLFDRSFTIDGGNIASTLAGEYDFSLALCLALVFLGITVRALRRGGLRPWAALALAATVLSHVVVGMYASFGALVAVGFVRGQSSWRERLRWGVPVAVVAAALCAWWAFPFVAGLPYTTNMGWVNVSSYVSSLFPAELRWVLPLAVIGSLVAIFERMPGGRLLLVLTAASGIAFVAMPQGKLYNARVLPFWILGLYLLAGLGAGRCGAWLAAALRPRARRLVSDAAVPGVLCAAALVIAQVPLGLPSWSPWRLAPSSFVPSWVRWNYSGYQAKPAWPEYHGLMSTMASVGHRYGCGRAMWEYGPGLNALGTPMALMLLPYWTHGCVDSMEGLLFESSATTPYHFINQAELSERPSEAMVGLPYGGLDVAKGVRHLQQLGVRYYMAYTNAAKSQANADPSLRLVARSGPWPSTAGAKHPTRTWNIYLVHGSAMVRPLRRVPSVMTQVPPGAKGWLTASMKWYVKPGPPGVQRAASGPASWPRAPWWRPVTSTRPLAADKVSHLVVRTQSISFDVTRTGLPVLVKVSYFPNWHASGAAGPWRVAPNLMVVVPSSHHVSLHYGWSLPGALGAATTVAGIGGIGALAWLDRRARRRAEPGRAQGVAASAYAAAS